MVGIIFFLGGYIFLSSAPVVFPLFSLEFGLVSSLLFASHFRELWRLRSLSNSGAIVRNARWATRRIIPTTKSPQKNEMREHLFIVRILH